MSYVEGSETNDEATNPKYQIIQTLESARFEFLVI